MTPVPLPVALQIIDFAMPEHRPEWVDPFRKNIAVQERICQAVTTPPIIHTLTVPSQVDADVWWDESPEPFWGAERSEPQRMLVPRASHVSLETHSEEPVALFSGSRPRHYALPPNHGGKARVRDEVFSCGQAHGRGVATGGTGTPRSSAGNRRASRRQRVRAGKLPVAAPRILKTSGVTWNRIGAGACRISKHGRCFRRALVDQSKVVIHPRNGRESAREVDREPYRQ